MEAPTRGRPEAVDAVKVVVRVRPLNAKERQDQTKSCVRIASSPDGLSSNNRSDTGGGPQQLIVGKDRAFTFDEVFGIDSSQQDVYKDNVEALVDCFLEGYNATVLAYGQTGTGKTHTMSGSGVDPKSGKSDDLQGIIPRVIRAIFEKMQTNQQRREYSLRVEYIEIYNEELRDLLHPETPSKQLSIREDAEGNIIMAGVKSETAQSREAVLRLLSLGGASRVTGSTMMNEQSSRSHAIFSLIVQQRDLATDERRKAKFHLVDLAGSERAKRTGAVAGRFKESISINQGLLALGNVISALSDEKRKLGATDKPGTSGGGGVHVPYRDSKLTRLLQDSLGGNAKTLMIACVSPATVNFEETLNTLKYANRAKNIKNRPIVNQQTQEEKQRADDEIARMKEEIALLQSQLHSTKPPATPSTAGGSSSRPETASSSSSSSSRSRRHSVAVSTSTSTTTMGADAAASEQDLAHLRKKCRAYADTIEAMRGLNVEAITSLVAMEREIKPLGRPVQHQLNEIVKTLNAAVQAVGSVESSLRKSLSVVPGGGADSTSHTDAYERVAKELKEAKANLARDEEIFEMKNAEIKRLQTFVAEAKVKNEKLIERVQELERSGQLWANEGPAASVAVVHPSRLASPKQVTPRRSRQDEASSTAVPPLPTSNMDVVPSGADVVDAKRTSSSRGLFTKRAGTAMAFAAPQEDNVLIGNEDDDADEHNAKKPSTASRRSVTSPRGGHRDSRTAAGESLGADDHQRHSGGAVAKMEKMLATLRGKVDELQQQNSELQHGREEALRRWQLERQQYERAAGEAEQTIEVLRAAKQALEDALIEDTPGETRPKVRGSQQRQQQSPQRAVASEIVMDEHGELLGGWRPATASATPSLTPSDAVALFDASVRHLMEYNQARDQVLRLVQDKKAAQQSVDAASKRLNALEMQKLRQSLSLRESIADAARSLRGLDASMQRGDVEQQSAEELERLAKLRHRAERKLAALRRQEARGEFLDKDAQHEAADLEELIEDLNSRIAFQDAELTAARDEMALARQRAPLEQPSPLDALALAAVEALGIKAASSESAAVAFVKKCLDDVARLRAREQELRAELSACGATLSERDAALAQLEAALEASRREFDRRLQLQRQEAQDAVAALERENALLAQVQDQRVLEPEQPEQSERVQDEEWRKLIVSCQKKDAYITDLEKHVVFYKAKAKQMQGQLQQLIRDSAVGNQGDDHAHDDAEQQQQLQRRVQQLEAANDALMKDLAAAKVYLQLAKSRGSHDGAQVVRVSKSELRELPRRPPTAVACRGDDE